MISTLQGGAQEPLNIGWYNARDIVNGGDGGAQWLLHPPLVWCQFLYGRALLIEQLLHSNLHVTPSVTNISIQELGHQHSF